MVLAKLYGSRKNIYNLWFKLNILTLPKTVGLLYLSKIKIDWVQCFSKRKTLQPQLTFS